MVFDNSAFGYWLLANDGQASPDLDRSAPGYLTPASEKVRLPGAPISPVAHDDSLKRGGCGAAQL